MEEKVVEKSLIGAIIDLPIEEFKEELKNQKVPIGVASNLKLHLVAEFEQCKKMLDELKDAIFAGRLDAEAEDVKSSYVSLYASMQKIEDEVTCLDEYIGQLQAGLSFDDK